MRRFRPFLATLAVGAMLVAAPALASEGGGSAQIAVDAFLAGTPLSAGERSALAADIARTAQTDPREAAAREKNAESALGYISKGNPRLAARVRELYRVYVAEEPASRAERRIVERHDPTVALSRTNSLIVTAHTLGAIERASAWGARVGGVALPANFLATERAALAAGFVNANVANQLAYARVESNSPLGIDALEKLPLAQQRQALLKNGPLNGAVGIARDSVAAILYAAAQTAGTAAVGYGSAGGGGMTAGVHTNLMMRQLIDQQMRQGIFQIGHPQCAPGGAQPSDCSQAPILQPALHPPF